MADFYDPNAYILVDGERIQQPVLTQEALEDFWRVMSNVGGGGGVMPTDLRQPTPGELQAYSYVTSGQYALPDIWDSIRLRSADDDYYAPPTYTPVDQYGWAQYPGSPYISNVWTGYIAPAGTVTSASLVGSPPPERDSGMFGVDFLDNTIGAVLEPIGSAVGSATDWTMKNVMGGPVMEAIAEQTPLLTQIAMTAMPGVGAVTGPAMAALSTTAEGGDWQDAALAAAIQYAAAVAMGNPLNPLPNTGADVLGVGMGGAGEASTLAGAQAAQAAASASSGMLGIPENPPGIGNPYQNSTPLVYGSPEFYQAASQLGLSPEQAMSLTDTSLGGISANQLYQSAGGTVPSTSTTNPYSTALKVMGKTLLAGGGGGAAGYNAISSPNLSLGTGTSNYRYNPSQFSAPQQGAGLLSSIPQRKSLSLPEDFLKPKDKQRFDLSAFRDPWSQERDKYWNYLA